MQLSALVAGLLTVGVATVSAGPIEADRKIFCGCLSKSKIPLVYPKDDKFADLAEPFNLRLAYTPAVIALPETQQHVQDAVVCAKECDFKVQAKSGGHSYASFSSGGKNGSMVIDLQNFQEITINPTDPTLACFGAGLRIGNLAHGLSAHGRALPHGTCTGVGVGGHFTHGGYGHTSRNWGLAMDTITGVDVVLADGTALYADATQNKEVFWAVRGAGESIGIITRFHVKTEAAPRLITYFQFKWEGMFGAKKEEFVDHFMHLQDFARNETVVDRRISFGTYIDGTVYNLGGAFFGTPEEFKTKIQPEFLRTLRTPAAITVEEMPWYQYLILVSDKTSIIEPISNYDDHANFFAKSITVPEHNGLTKDNIGAMWDFVQKNPAPTPWFIITNLYGGPGSSINKPKAGEGMAYADRDSLWVLQIYGHQIDKDPSAPNGNFSIPFITGLTKSIVSATPETHFGAYLNYVDPELSAKEAHELYYGKEIYEKLVQVKKAVDPTGLFWNPQAIGVE